MYIRFVVGSDGDDHRQLTGIFTEARILREADRLMPPEEAMLEEAYEWFNEHLPVPPYSRRLRRGVAWFKDDASECLKQVWHLVALLREHHVPVRLLRSRNPGRVLYEDEFQVVVEEWAKL